MGTFLREWMEKSSKEELSTGKSMNMEDFPLSAFTVKDLPSLFKLMNAEPLTDEELSELEKRIKSYRVHKTTLDV